MEYLYENLIPSDSILKYTEKDDILYFDIETTGLSKAKNCIYLIGCGYYSCQGLHIIQWFAEKESEEINVLKCFEEFSSSFTSLVNYNGKSFDIPFTTERMKLYGLNMPEFNSTDIFTLIKPLKKFLSLNDLTQKSIESFLGVDRDDKYNGGELIYVYKKYTQYKNKTDLEKLLLHNKEDVLNMHYISAITEYLSLLESDFVYSDFVEKKYRDYSGTEKAEIILEAKHTGNKELKSFNSFYNNESGSFIMNFSNSGKVSVRIPIIEACLKYYMSNYRDYYYLPEEDMCIYKSMGGAIEKNKIENAKKDTCYVKCTDSFIPLPNKSIMPENVKSFRNEYKCKCEYIRLSDFINMNENDKSIYIKSVINSFM